MTASDQDSKDWAERLGAWLGARWQWLVIAVLLLFALNNVLGIVVGALGLIAFANRIAGRLLSAGRVVRQVREIVIEPDDSRDDSGDDA